MIERCATGGRGFTLVAACVAACAAIHADAQPFVPARTAQCVAYSPSGEMIATGISGMANGEIPLRPHPSPRKCAEILLFHAETGERVRRIEWFGDLTDVQFSPDGKLVAASRVYRTVEGLDFNGVQIWDVATGKVVRALERAHAFDFSPEGKAIAVVSQRNCTLFDLASGERSGQVKPLGGAIAVQFAPDGKRLVGIARADSGFQLRACDVQNENVVNGLALEEPFYSFDISNDGSLIASGHEDGNALVWNASTLVPVKRLQSGGSDRTRPIFSPDGKRLALCGQAKADVVFFDVKTGREMQRMHFDRGQFATLIRREEQETVRPESDPRRFAFSPDGKLFLTGCFGGVIRRMDSGGEVRRLTP